ncbi:AbrB family transcriptional regulator [Lysinibacillus irui]|uniref:AbrB family transcriptional regulator n=1 Tax=Lysinibacillus irui TaxID=2998077 RepID=A0AAJ5RP10_9BACI|nr:AbrB family transcriptional regulator [Lysinibacillus irui]WDV08137.1 AbrB family transcriptional regulator [Lysinibacillus irui]
MFVFDKHMLITLCIGLIGAVVFQLLHIPMPWLLGAITAVLIVQLSTNVQLKWHHYFRNFGLIVAGYSIGYAFTPEAVQDIKLFLGSMILLNVLFIVLFFAVSLLVAKRTDIDFATALTCCVPGGMSQVVAFAEEQGNMDMAVITFFQILRVLLIVGFVPLMVAGAGSNSSLIEGTYSWSLVAILVVCGLAGWLAQKLKIPTGYMLGPVFLLMGINMAGIEVPKLPLSLLHIAQLMIGIYIGLLLKKEDLHLSKEHIFYAFVSAGIFIGAAYGLTFIMTSLYKLDFRTGFLSVVPGGLDQMGIIAASVHANVTIVTAFQLFRVLVVSVFLVPVVKMFVKKAKT